MRIILQFLTRLLALGAAAPSTANDDDFQAWHYIGRSEGNIVKVNLYWLGVSRDGNKVYWNALEKDIELSNPPEVGETFEGVRIETVSWNEEENQYEVCLKPFTAESPEFYVSRQAQGWKLRDEL